jgi:hypothetical protein
MKDLESGIAEGLWPSSVVDADMAESGFSQTDFLPNLYCGIYCLDSRRISQQNWPKKPAWRSGIAYLSYAGIG